jgi:hypothetical protein
MSKQLYDEALADVMKLKEVAENNAKRVILESVTPRIRELIEQQILAEAVDDEKEEDEEILLDEQPTSEPVNQDVPATVVEGDDEFETQLSSVQAESASLMKLTPRLRLTEAFGDRVTKMISRVENMYEHVQVKLHASSKKTGYEDMLEEVHQNLNNLQETFEMAKKKLNEEDVTVTLTNLPDEIDLDAIGVNLETGEEDEFALSGDDEQLATDDLGAEPAGDDIDFDVPEEEPTDDVQESASSVDLEGLDDDTVVEIDENMLRAEIARMKKIRESACCDDFGGAKDEGDPLDAEVKAEGKGEDFGGAGDEGEPLETEMCNEDVDDDVIDLTDDAESQDDSVTGAGSVDFSDADFTGGEAPLDHKQFEAKLKFEARNLARNTVRAKQVREAIAKARGTKNVKLESKLRSEFVKLVSRINESKSNINKIQGLIAESKKKTVNEARHNAASKSRTEEADLRKQLAEANLFNTKLFLTNKLLQNENLSKKQKAQIIARIDETKSNREAKLVYESLTKTLAARSVNESTARPVIGTASRATSTSSSVRLNESTSGDDDQLNRWAKIAGLK